MDETAELRERVRASMDARSWVCELPELAALRDLAVRALDNPRDRPRLWAHRVLSSIDQAALDVLRLVVRGQPLEALNEIQPHAHALETWVPHMGGRHVVSLILRSAADVADLEFGGSANSIVKAAAELQQALYQIRQVLGTQAGRLAVGLAGGRSVSVTELRFASELRVSGQITERHWRMRELVLSGDHAWINGLSFERLQRIHSHFGVSRADARALTSPRASSHGRPHDAAAARFAELAAELWFALTGRPPKAGRSLSPDGRAPRTTFQAFLCAAFQIAGLEASAAKHAREVSQKWRGPGRFVR